LTHLLDTLAFNQMIIFVNRVDRAKKLTELLRQKLFNPICIHSQLKQEERIKNYDLFKANGSRLLVATDLFGRGIDIERVNLVINYGISKDIQTSPQKETPTCTEWAEPAVLARRDWRSTSSGQMRKKTKRAEPTRQY
jgi:superfamily II DNA/RNA helicase